MMLNERVQEEKASRGETGEVDEVGWIRLFVHNREGKREREQRFGPGVKP
jgi:hypothetical protein